MRHLYCIALATATATATAGSPVVAQPSGSSPAPSSAPASVAPRSASAEGGYAHAALAVAPRWSGLALAAGARGRRVGELGFFWPGDVRAVFAGGDSAMHYAQRAVATRRV